VEPTKTVVTTLPNGLKVASKNSSSPTASIGLYVDCGSLYETPLSSGATHLLERMAFKTTKNRSHLRMVREVEAIGGNVTASASREQMGYTFDALKTYLPEMVELLIDSVRNTVFLDWEVNEQLVKVKSEIAEISNNPQSLILEAHRVFLDQFAPVRRYARVALWTEALIMDRQCRQQFQGNMADRIRM